MAKKIVAKTGSFTKDGQEKAEWTRIGAIMSNANGEYILLDPKVDLSGVLLAQNLQSVSEGKPARKNVMCSIFEDQPRQNGYNQAPAQHSQQHQAARQPPTAPQAPTPPGDFNDYDEDIPF